MRGLVLLAFAIGCGDDPVHPLGDASPQSLVITPADLTLTVLDGQVVTQGYTATLPDGTDVTASTTFTLSKTAYGAFSGPSLSVSGAGAGPVRVQGSASGVTGDTGLTVLIRNHVVDPTLPPGTPGMFDGATENPALAPQIAYPLDNILVPPNLGQFDVHWHNDTGNVDNVFEIKMANEYVDVRLYTSGLDATNPQPFWTLFQPDAWYPIASTREQLTLSVAGMNSADPTQKGTAAAQHVDVTNEDAQGGIYYWSTSSPQGIYRYDVAKPSVPPAPYFPMGEEPGGSGNCMGCHSLSRDGTKIALTIDSAYGRGTVVDVATRALQVPVDSNPIYWNFATFTPNADKLVTLENGIMQLRMLDGTPIGDPIANSPGLFASHPEFSPDGKWLVSVEGGEGDLYIDSGGIVRRSFDAATNTFGPPQMLLAQDPDGTSSYYPSYSPDGNWLAITRVIGSAYNNNAAETWAMKADGSAPPVKLATANLADPNLTNSWARWVPFQQTFGGNAVPLFYLTFSSVRPFGVRLPNGGQPQIWMTPFFPDKAAAGMDPSGPAFRVPFQGISTNNHIAQWTQQVVIVQ